MQCVLMQCSMNHDGPYYFDDFHVGQRFESAPHVTTEAEALAFAKRYDPQPHHTDPVAAKDSLFGQLVLSGWETAAIAMRHPAPKAKADRRITAAQALHFAPRV